MAAVSPAGPPPTIRQSRGSSIRCQARGAVGGSRRLVLGGAMGLKDLMFVAPFIVAEGVLAVLIAYALGRFRPQWPRRRVLGVAALPIPIVIWVLSISVFVSASTASKEECGVDACGMAVA